MIKDLFPIPTGYLFTSECENGLLETLSIGDYGKAHNVKADFLGYTNDIEGVPNMECMPLSSKWVITLSTQYGCPMKCNFCDVPNVDFKGNASYSDFWQQLKNAIKLFPSVKYTDRLNIHFARMGEPIFNFETISAFVMDLYDHKYHMIQEDCDLRVEVIHPVLTTSLPRKYKRLLSNLQEWCYIKNHPYSGQAGLQFSINSTNEEQRSVMFSDMQLHLEEFSELARELPVPVGRKYCLNFAYAFDFEVDAIKLVNLFNPDNFMVKITPIHNNNACRANGIETLGGYETFAPYAKIEKELKEVGFDVLVFVPSMDEEDGLVTCGNVVLGGSVMRPTDVIKIKGLNSG